MRRSQASASSHPPPSAKPLIIAITGLGQAAIASKTRGWCHRGALLQRRAGRELPDVRSGDEGLLAGSGEHQHTHRGSAASAATAATSSLRTVAFSALRFSCRSIVMVATPPSCSIRSVS
jgi:hypothetical protein